MAGSSPDELAALSDAASLGAAPASPHHVAVAGSSPDELAALSDAASLSDSGAHGLDALSDASAVSSIVSAHRTRFFKLTQGFTFGVHSVDALGPDEIAKDLSKLIAFLQMSVGSLSV